LTERNKTGRLTAEETEALAQLLAFDDIVTLLKAKALKTLN
jgi:hypothetical protein